MSKKRSVFDIEFDLDEAAADDQAGFPAGNPPDLETKSHDVQGHPLQNSGPVRDRRGPMASAIAETLEANDDRASTEANIRAENDALAHEHVRLKKLGLITDLLPTDQILTGKLTRDRSTGIDPELEELKDSIQGVGLSNPIRVEQTDEGYELIQGFRRLSAFRALAVETGDARYTRIPAALVPRGEPLNALYRKMVDENLVRKDITFGEMAQLAISFAKDMGIDADTAVGQLYGSVLKQKRRYIRQFVRVLELAEGAIAFPEALPRALGLDLHKAFDARPDDVRDLVDILQKTAHKDAATEVGLLKAFLANSRTARPALDPKGKAKTSLRLPQPDGEARVVATDGRIELRLDRDFSTVPKEQLQAAIETFLDQIRPT